ncbi:hypothetical protein AB3X96_41450 [Paraburkholderia sp. BR13439]|uniref:hypothetical protein n=1 Tax=unclassified Paraburkholderia TaxID=2615204 RepID=UPI0034CEBFEE
MRNNVTTAAGSCLPATRPVDQRILELLGASSLSPTEDQQGVCANWITPRCTVIYIPHCHGLIDEAVPAAAIRRLCFEHPQHKKLSDTAFKKLGRPARRTTLLVINGARGAVWQDKRFS